MATSPENTEYVNLYDRFFPEKYTFCLKVHYSSGIFALWSTIHKPLNSSAQNRRLRVWGKFYCMDFFIIIIFILNLYLLKSLSIISSSGMEGKLKHFFPSWSLGNLNSISEAILEHMQYLAFKIGGPKWTFYQGNIMQKIRSIKGVNVSGI